jgi:flagellar biosynthesis/type III secretory pathway protein FliH
VEETKAQMAKRSEVRPDDYRSSYRLPDWLYRQVMAKANAQLAEEGGRRMSMTDAIQEALEDWSDASRLERISEMMRKYQNQFESIAKQLDQIEDEQTRDEVAGALMQVVAGIAKQLASLPYYERERAMRGIVATVRVSVEMYQQYAAAEDPKKKRIGG